MNLTKKQVVFGICTILIFPFLSNALWEYFGRSFIDFIIQSILKTLSHVHSEFRDSLYIEVAKGLHESSSLHVFVTINLVILGIGIGTAVGLIMRNRARNTIENEKDLVEHSHEEIEYLNSKVKFLKGEVKKAEKRINIVSICFAVSCSLLIIPCMINYYSNTAITFYNQSLKICSPYMNDQSIKQIESKFSLIKTKKDYIDVINSLNETAEKNRLKLPMIWIW